MIDLVEKYGECKELKYSKGVLSVISCDIMKYCKEPVYDCEVGYCGRGKSSDGFNLCEFIVPEFSDGMNYCCFIHDNLAELVDYHIVGYTKEFVDLLFKNLLECEGYDFLDDIYYEAVDKFGGDYDDDHDNDNLFVDMFG